VEYKLGRQGNRVGIAAVFCDIAPNEAEARLKPLVFRYVDPDSIDTHVAARAIMKQVSANVLAAATGGHVLLCVTGNSPEEIEQALLAELEAKGFTDSQVDVRSETVGDSTRVTHVDVQTGVPAGGGSGDSTVIDMIIVDEGR